MTVVAELPLIHREVVTDPTGQPWCVIAYRSGPSPSWLAALVRSCRVALTPLRDTPARPILEVMCRHQDTAARVARLVEQVKRGDFNR
jgi:hypothetical protein